MKKDHSLQRRPLFAPIWLPALAALVLLSVGAWLWRTADSTTVVVLRPAESQSGAARLAAAFGDPAAPGRIDALYRSSSAGARQTAAPLAARLGLQPIEAAAADSRALARRLLRENHGRRALVVADPEIMGRLAAALAGRGDLPAVAADDYDIVYVVTVPDVGRGTVLRLRY